MNLEPLGENSHLDGGWGPLTLRAPTLENPEDLHVGPPSLESLFSLPSTLLLLSSQCRALLVPLFCQLTEVIVNSNPVCSTLAFPLPCTSFSWQPDCILNPTASWALRVISGPAQWLFLLLGHMVRSGSICPPLGLPGPGEQGGGFLLWPS